MRLFLGVISVFAAALYASEDGPLSESVCVRHIEGKGIGYHHGYTSVDLFLTPSQTFCWFTPFIDARAHIFNDGKFASNIGAGIRYLEEDWEQIFGLNLFYDYRNTRRQHYNQVSCGLEMLGATWEYRINGYFPVGRTNTHFFNYFFEFFPSDSSFTLSAKRQFAMTGFDAEALYHFPECNCMEFYAALGPYYYSSHHSIDVHTFGGRLRLGGTFYTYFTAEAIVTYDHVFKWIGQGAIAINFPFGCPKTIRQTECMSCEDIRALEARMAQRVQHNEIIVVDKHRQSLK